MKKYNNILVHSLVNLGDVLLTTSAVALLKQCYPQAKISMMVRPAVADILQDNPLLDEVIIYDYKAKHKSVKSMLAFTKELRKRKFDVSISFDRKLRPALLTMLAGIPVRVGPERVFNDKPSWITMLYTHTIKVQHDIVNNLQAETYQAIIRGFTGCQGNAKPVTGKITAANLANAQALFSTLPAKRHRIALCVKGTFALKTWPGDRFAQVVDILSQRYDAAFFIIGAPEDRQYADKVASLTKVPVANFCGKTTLRDLVALFEQTDLFITVDTGAMHIAATTKVPIVAIFGCTSPKRWHPLSDKSKVLFRNLDCCPCAIPEDACPEHKCMDIAVSEVVEAVETGHFLR